MMVAALQGEIVGLKMDLKDARLYVAEIRHHFTIAEHHANQARKLIWELNSREGWRALGYTSWRACVMAEFEQSSSTVYRQLNAALVELELSPAGGNVGEINERVLRPLTKREYSAESRRLIWDISQDIVGQGGKITSGVVESVVEGISDWLKTGTVQSPDGNQHAITEHLRADLTARVREVRLAHKEHIKRMDAKRDYILGGVESKVTRGQLDSGRVAVIVPIDDLQRDKLAEALRLGKPIYTSLWVEE